MGMNNRLLRPRQTIHAEAADWANRVRTNGGTVSGSTLSAVDKFVKSIHQNGLRSKLVRVNLMCGSNLNAVLVPLFRATSRTGTQLGNATDTNDNFTNDHYAENSGLVGNASNRRLATGLARSSVSADASLHMGVFLHSRDTNQFRQYIRFSAAATGFSQGGLDSRANPAKVVFQNSAAASTGETGEADHAGGDFVVGCTSGAGAGLSRLYVNGTSAATGTGVNSSAVNAGIALFARQNASNSAWDLHSNARIGGYTIGLNLDDTESSAYATIWDTFLKALGRR